MVSAILEGEESTKDTLLRAEVLMAGIDIDIFDRDKGMVRITLSDEKWVLLERYINEGREKLRGLREKAKKSRIAKESNTGTDEILQKERKSNG